MHVAVVSAVVVGGGVVTVATDDVGVVDLLQSPGKHAEIQWTMTKGDNYLEFYPKKQGFSPSIFYRGLRPAPFVAYSL